MKQRLSALLVHHEADPLRALEQSLRNQSLKTARARSCREVWQALTSADPPHLVFTDTKLPDGSWVEVLALATKSPVPVNVIVVGRIVDTRVYVEAIEAGAFDFVVPPFAVADLDYVVRCAADNVLARRQAGSDAAGSRPPGLFSPAPQVGLQVTERAEIS